MTSLAERIFRSLNKQRLPSLDVDIICVVKGNDLTGRYTKILTICKEKKVHDNIILATEDRLLAFSIAVRVLFQDYYQKSGRSVLGNLQRSCFWKPYIIPFLDDCIWNITTMRRLIFDLKLVESLKSHKAHLSRLGSSCPMWTLAGHSKSPSVCLKHPLICAIRRLVFQVAFASECTGHSVKLACTEKTYATMPQATFVQESIEYGLGSYALYLRVIKERVDEGLYEEMKSIPLELHQDFQAFSHEMKLVFLTNIIFGGDIELEFDAEIRVERNNISYHTITIYAFSTKDCISRIHNAEYPRYRIVSITSAGDKKSIKKQACKLALEKLFDAQTDACEDVICKYDTTSKTGLCISGSYESTSLSGERVNPSKSFGTAVRTFRSFLPNAFSRSLLRSYRETISGKGFGLIEERANSRHAALILSRLVDNDSKAYRDDIQTSPLRSLLECYKQAIHPKVYRMQLQRKLERAENLCKVANLHNDGILRCIAKSFCCIYGFPIHTNIRFLPTQVPYRWVSCVYFLSNACDMATDYQTEIPTADMKLPETHCPLAIAKSEHRNDAMYAAYKSLVTAHFPREFSRLFLPFIGKYTQRTLALDPASIYNFNTPNELIIPSKTKYSCNIFSR